MNGRTRRALLASAPVLFLLSGLAACGPRSARPNLLLVVIDTLRADRLGCYGYARNTSPAIDRLAARSARFDNAFTVAPWTLPAFASLLTSTPPWEHGAVNDYLAPRPELPALADVLGAAGYETAAFVSHIYTSRTYGFARGFDRFEDFGIAENYAFDEGREPRADRVVGEAVRWLESRRDRRPFFLLVHLFDPHWDYAAPEPFRTRFDPDYAGPADGTYRTISRFLHPDSIPDPRDLTHIEALYDGEIAYADAWIDTLLRALDRSGETDRTAIVLTADHGEEFRDHASMGHSFTFYDEVLRVPLLLFDPADPKPGRVVSEPASLLDILPTFAALAGVEPPPGARGRPLGAEIVEPRIMDAGTVREGRYGRAFLAGPLKLVWDRTGFRLFDRSADPLERADLLGGAPAPSHPRAAPFAERLFEQAGGGGWFLSWDASSGAHPEVSGEIDPDGIVIDLLPLEGEPPRIEATGNGLFRFRASGKGGLRFRLAPPESRVAFRLSVGGEAKSDRIFVGREGFHPPNASFGLDPASTPEAVLAEPGASPPDRPWIRLWKGADPPAPPLIELADDILTRLEGLGYITR